jgi:hypothetical protein
LFVALGAVAGCGDDDFGPGADPRFSISAARLLSTGSPTKDEDPSVLRAADGSMFVAWFSDRDDGAGDIYLVRTPRERNWSAATRVTVDPGGDFYPSLIQDAAGTFHLTWFRWYALERGHILHSTSSDGLTWNVANEESVTTDPDVDDWLPTPAFASDGTLFVYFVSDLRDAVNPTSEIYVVSKGPSDTDWSAPVAAAGLNSATEHDQLPFVARTGSGFTMVWVRHDTSEPKPWLNPKSQLYHSTSSDGLSWSTPRQVTNDAGNVVHLFPSIVTTISGEQSVLWLSNRAGAARPYQLLVANVDQYPSTVAEVTRLSDGYSHRVAETSTAGVFLGVWVQGPEGEQEIYYRFFER